MAVKSVAVQELLDELLRNTERSIEIIVKREQNVECTNLPLFTKREKDRITLTNDDQNARSIIKAREQGFFFSLLYCNLSCLP